MNKQKLTTYLLLVLLAVFPFACSEPIELRTDVEGGQLIIFGRITNGTFGNFVNVSRSGLAGEEPLPQSGALVRVVNSRGESLQLRENEPGNYEIPDGGSFGEVGVSYELEVSVGGKTYTTSAQELPENIGRETMSWELREVETISSAGIALTDNVASISSRTDFDELPDEFYLRWDIEEAYTYIGTFLPLGHFPLSGGAIQCYVENDLNEQRVFLHNGKENRAPAIPSRVYVDRTVDKSFQTLHYFNLIRSTINKETYDYWSKLDLIVNRQGSIFDVPPAPLPGNIQTEDDEVVLGFFEVVYADTTRLPLTRRDVPVTIYDECVKRGEEFQQLFTVPRDCRQCLADEGIVAESCLYCGILPGSGYVRPSYF